MEWTRESFEEALGYWRARVLHSALELDVFSPLESGPAGAPDIASAVGAEPQTLEMLLDALAGLELLEKGDEGYALTSFARAYLLPGRVEYLGDAGLTLARDWDLWGALTEHVRKGRRPDREDIFTGDPAGARLLERALRADSLELAPALIDRIESAGIDLSAHRAVLDVGGGHAVYSATLCARYPGMSATVFDLPVPLEIARETAKELGVEGRLSFVAGDYRTRPLPVGHDLALLSYVLHGAGPTEARRLLGRVQRALEAGGRLLIQEALLSDDRTKPASAAVFGLNLLLHTGQGRCLTKRELVDWLLDVDFEDVRDVGSDTLVAAKPS